jgi:hypothetical protein
MRKQGRIILTVLLAGSLLWSCSENFSALDSATLKSTIDKSAFNLNTAVDAISATKAYSILTVTDAAGKSVDDVVYKVNIPLETVKGVYNYKPVTSVDRWGISLIKFFTKSADDAKMIVNLPLKKVTNPRSLRQYVAADSALTNNFSIAVFAYHNNYNNYHDFDYNLESEISVDNAVAGELNIDYLVSPTLGIKYASQYAFTDGYTADYKYQSGDTAVSSFAISKEGKVLYEEKRLNMKSDTGRFGREHQYILTIGDVSIVRKSGVKTVDVYVGGILQSAAIVEIVDKDDDAEASVCKKRDIKITFEDGTTTTVSALIGNSVENIKTLFDSLHSVYFAAYIVDWIAYDIYYNRI